MSPHEQRTRSRARLAVPTDAETALHRRRNPVRMPQHPLRVRPGRLLCRRPVLRRPRRPDQLAHRQALAVLGPLLAPLRLDGLLDDPPRRPPLPRPGPQRRHVLGRRHTHLGGRTNRRSVQRRRKGPGRLVGLGAAGPVLLVVVLADPPALLPPRHGRPQRLRRPRFLPAGGNPLGSRAN